MELEYGMLMGLRSLVVPERSGVVRERHKPKRGGHCSVLPPFFCFSGRSIGFRMAFLGGTILFFPTHPVTVSGPFIYREPLKIL